MSEVKRDEKDLKKSLLEIIRSKINQEPFIVFMAKDDGKLINDIEVMCDKSKVAFVHIKDPQEASQQRLEYNSNTTGVFILQRKFGRGYDLKLGTEATVLILANENSISQIEAIQMVGRGCRSQGQGKGILFLKGDPHAKKDAWEYLKVRNEGHRDSGGANLRFLF